MKKIIIFDGHNLLFKYFFGLPPFIKSKDGELIHGVLGVLACILRQLKKFDPIYPIVCFDSQEPSTKEKNSTFYKQNRIKVFDQNPLTNPFTQLPLLLKCLEFLNIPYVFSEKIEADEQIGGLAKKYSDLKYLVYISSGDMDFLQLVDSQISVYRETGKRELTYTPATIRELFNLNPIQMIDYKSMIGDKSDNISGIPSVGPKTAQRLLIQFNSIDNIYQNIDKIPIKLATKLNANKEKLQVNRALIRIETNQQFNSPELRTIKNLNELSVKSIFQNLNIWN